MSNLKRRLEKLEASHSPKWYLWIKVGAEESDDEAIRRTAAEMGIRPEDIGFVDLWYLNDESPRRPVKQVDFGGHAGKETLRGYVRFEDLLLEILAERKERKAAEDSVSSQAAAESRKAV